MVIFISQKYVSSNPSTILFDNFMSIAIRRSLFIIIKRNLPIPETRNSFRQYCETFIWI